MLRKLSRFCFHDYSISTNRRLSISRENFPNSLIICENRKSFLLLNFCCLRYLNKGQQNALKLIWILICMQSICKCMNGVLQMTSINLVLRHNMHIFICRYWQSYLRKYSIVCTVYGMFSWMLCFDCCHGSIFKGAIRCLRSRSSFLQHVILLGPKKITSFIVDVINVHNKE